MENTYWHKQDFNKPLYPDILWSRPETKQTAGKLLIIGGNIHGFAAVGVAYNTAQKAGIGSIRIIMPDALQKTVSKLMPEAIFVPSNPSGSFGQAALAECLEHASWADGTIIVGDLGRNSQTAILLEKFATKYRGPLTITKDASDYFVSSPQSVVNRDNTNLTLTMAQLQKFAVNLKFKRAFTFDMNLRSIVEQLHDFTNMYPINILLKHLDTVFIAVQSQVSTTKINIEHEDEWRVPIAASAAVWWLQNPGKVFEALTTSVTSI